MTRHTNKPYAGPAGGFDPKARATDAQLRFIDSLAAQAGYAHSSHAIKEVLGKNPVNGLSRERASRVIDFLKS